MRLRFEFDSDSKRRLTRVVHVHSSKHIVDLVARAVRAFSISGNDLPPGGFLELTYKGQLLGGYNSRGFIWQTTANPIREIISEFRAHARMRVFNQKGLLVQAERTSNDSYSSSGWQVSEPETTCLRNDQTPIDVEVSLDTVSTVSSDDESEDISFRNSPVEDSKDSEADNTRKRSRASVATSRSGRSVTMTWKLEEVDVAPKRKRSTQKRSQSVGAAGFELAANDGSHHDSRSISPGSSVHLIPAYHNAESTEFRGANENVEPNEILSPASDKTVQPVGYEEQNEQADADGTEQHQEAIQQTQANGNVQQSVHDEESERIQARDDGTGCENKNDQAHTDGTAQVSKNEEEPKEARADVIMQQSEPDQQNVLPVFEESNVLPVGEEQNEQAVGEEQIEQAVVPAQSQEDDVEHSAIANIDCGPHANPNHDHPISARSSEEPQHKRARVLQPIKRSRQPGFRHIHSEYLFPQKYTMSKCQKLIPYYSTLYDTLAVNEAVHNHDDNALLETSQHGLGTPNADVRENYQPEAEEEDTSSTINPNTPTNGFRASQQADASSEQPAASTHSATVTRRSSSSQSVKVSAKDSGHIRTSLSPVMCADVQSQDRQPSDPQQLEPSTTNTLNPNPNPNPIPNALNPNTLNSIPIPNPNPTPDTLNPNHTANPTLNTPNPNPNPNDAPVVAGVPEAAFEDLHLLLDAVGMI